MFAISGVHAGAMNEYEAVSACSSWTSHLQVARMAYEKGLYSAALRNYQTALQAAEVLALPEQELAVGLVGLARCYCGLGNFSEAEALYRRVLQIEQHCLSAHCCSLAMDLNDLGVLYLKTGRLAEAENLLRKALELLSGLSGNALEKAVVEKNLGHYYCLSGNLTEAQRYVDQALARCDTAEGRQEKVFAEVLIAKSLVATKKGCYCEAEELMERAIANFEVVTGGEHPELAEFLDIAAELFRLENVPDKVKELTVRARAMRRTLRELDR